MNPIEQREAIAKACGWTEQSLGWWRHEDHKLDAVILPDYLNDLNAMHEAEKILTPKQWNTYTVNLARTIAECHDANIKVSVPTNVLLSATAAQRAEAFLRTLGLWK